MSPQYSKILNKKELIENSTEKYIHMHAYPKREKKIYGIRFRVFKKTMLHW